MKKMSCWRQNWCSFGKKSKSFVFFNPSRALREPFYLLTITLLSLLLPLSFLLLARLFYNSYFHGFSSISSSTAAPYPISLILSLFFDTNPTLLLALLSSFGVATLVQGLTTTSSPGRSGPVRGPRLYTAWVCLCAFQVFVCLGIEGSIAAGIQGASSPLGTEQSNRRFLSRIAFFLGLHEMMLHWARVVVKPVVDDSILGGPREERWLERVTTAAGFGTMWWWRLRDEVEALVVVPEVKKELLMSLGMADFVGLWLYYLTITIGLVKVLKSVLWVSMILICRRFRRQGHCSDTNGGEDKV